MLIFNSKVMILAGISPLVDKLMVYGFFIGGAIFVIGAVINANELSRRIGLPSWKEWWKEIKKH